MRYNIVKQANRFVRLILLFLWINFSLNAQTKYSPRYPGVKVTGTKVGELNVPKATPGSLIFKFRYESADSLYFELYAKEYINQEYVEKRFDLIQRANLKKGNTIFGELVPDISQKNKMSLFINFTGSSSMHPMQTSEDKCFKVAEFEKPDYTGRTFIPLLIIYEDDVENGIQENTINQYLKDGKIRATGQEYEQLLQKLPRYKLVYFNITFHK